LQAFVLWQIFQAVLVVPLAGLPGLLNL
jgi:hypothetical protein